MSSTDRIEKEILLNAPKPRVWRALTDTKEFGTWFGVQLDGPFAAGKSIHGKLTIKGYEDLILELKVEKIEPQDYFSYRWHPNAHDPKTDFSAEPMTLVEFRLEAAGQGTKLTVIESGFDKLPAARRDTAWRSNNNGWASQLKNIERHVAS